MSVQLPGNSVTKLQWRQTGGLWERSPYYFM